ncbi:TMEM175 family protein [Pigmentibacter sp. JX0631]|uniref:TMEM175 family protein n=1 Tax=Pigmentibacter sp. JX0631 TaxID=2976982 RepID=UPI002468E7BE|nr:TMEM175 family protein [Pigmentibacter sp. JX0631]WGL59805.1 TMEM175 family protein [Pigmentibacter sp. JX0631]
MSKARLEAFSDGVLAIIITIMVLELKIPHTDDLYELLPLLPIFLSYFLSFIYVGIYWISHHYILHLASQINMKVVWLNINFLFWISLLPFVTAWSGENSFAKTPVFLYGIVLFLSSSSFFLLTHALKVSHDKNSNLVKEIGENKVGKFSLLFYFIGIISTFYSPYISLIIYILLAFFWANPFKKLRILYFKN